MKVKIVQSLAEKLKDDIGIWVPLWMYRKMPLEATPSFSDLIEIHWCIKDGILNEERTR